MIVAQSAIEFLAEDIAQLEVKEPLDYRYRPLVVEKSTREEFRHLIYGEHHGCGSIELEFLSSVSQHFLGSLCTAWRRE